MVPDFNLIPMNLTILLNKIPRKNKNLKRLSRNHDPITIKKSMIRGSKLMSGTRNNGTKHITQTCGNQKFHRFKTIRNRSCKIDKTKLDPKKNEQIEQILPY